MDHNDDYDGNDDKDAARRRRRVWQRRGGCLFFTGTKWLSAVLLLRLPVVGPSSSSIFIRGRRGVVVKNTRN